jgi:peptidoglycan/xylan/chitin deacetylase (PgdA/CDA1 family)
MSASGSEPLAVIPSGLSRTPLEWAEGQTIFIPPPVLRDAGLLGRRQAGGQLSFPDPLPRIPTGAGPDLRLRAAYTPRPLSSRLPFSYRRIPGPLRRLVAASMGRWRRRRLLARTRFPLWPLDLSADFLADWAGGASAASPRTGPAPVVLTHDIDSPEGLSLLPRFLEIEESVGARSVNFVVPCGWPLDLARLDEVQARGHEIGIHGYDHRNLTPFCDAGERRRRIEAARPLIERYRARGYRAPSVLRTAELLRELARQYLYDSSIPSTGGPFPVPDTGCATARPFRLEGVWELPLSMPRDGSLRFLGYEPEEILEVWSTCARRIADSGGVVVLLTHCERSFSGNPAMLGIYRRFCEQVAADRRHAFRSPRDVLDRAAAQESTEARPA